MPDAGTEFRILTDSDVNFVVISHRRGDDIVFRSPAAFLKFSGLRIAVELPDRLPGLGLEPTEPTVAASKDHVRFAIDHRVRRVGPLAEHDFVSRRVILPGNFAGLLVDGDEAGRL